MTRHRATLGAERARIIHRLQQVLEEAHLKRASVVSDSRGLSARAMLAARLAGDTDPDTLAALARGQ